MKMNLGKLIFAVGLGTASAAAYAQKPNCAVWEPGKACTPGCRCGSGGSGSGASSGVPAGSNAANAILQILPSLVNIFSNPNADRERAEREAAAAAYQRQEQARKAEEARIEALAARRTQDRISDARKTISNPWARSGGGSQQQGAAKRALLAQSECVSVAHKNTGGVSEGLWRVSNGCGFPVQVIHCFYDDAKQKKCELNSTVGWGTTDTIPPGKFHYAVSVLPPATTRVWFFICDMRKGGICAKPDATVANR